MKHLLILIAALTISSIGATEASSVSSSRRSPTKTTKVQKKKSQNVTEICLIKDDKVKAQDETKTQDDLVFRSVAQMPTFPGGEAKLMKCVSEHINYPDSAYKCGIEGKVIVQFVVTKTGQVGEVKVVCSADPIFDTEAVRVCKTLPNFIPGRQNGEPVNVWYTLPITFRLHRK